MRKVRGYLLVVLLLVLGLLVVDRVFCWRVNEGDVAIPPVTAGPKDVVRAYVAALDKHDLGTARALSTQQQADRNPWYDTTRSITDLEVREPIPDSTEANAVFVPVTFDLDQCGGDGSMEDGKTGWGYTLYRPSSSTRWLITGEGPV